MKSLGNAGGRRKERLGKFSFIISVSTDEVYGSIEEGKYLPGNGVK